MVHQEVGKLMLESRRSNGSGKTIPIFRLSAQMVDLSLQHDQRDSLLTDSPAHFPIKSECYTPEPKVQLISASFASTTQEEAKKAAQLDCNTEARSGLVRASRELLRISISRISDHRVRIHDSRLWASIAQWIAWHGRYVRHVLAACERSIRQREFPHFRFDRVHKLRIGIVALAVLAFSAVYGLRGHHSDSVNSRSQIAPAVQQRQTPLVPATSIASKNTHKNPHTAGTSKSKSRRRQQDYVAKDTYVHYGKDGKPSH
jgi:hypothetical protein